jgi:hypothetical protein
MRPKPFAGLLLVTSLCLPLVVGMTPSAFAQSDLSHLTPAQTITPADLSKIELDYYKTLDSEAAKDFIATRSYVRLAKQVVDKKLQPSKFPPQKPHGFSVKYLLPDDPTVLNQALGEYLAATLKVNPQALDALGRATTNKTPGK